MRVYRASEAARNKACPGSYSAAMGLLAPSSKATDDGKLVHETAEVVINEFALNSIEDLDARILTFSELFRLNSWCRKALDFICTEIFDICVENGGAKAVIRESSYTLPLSETAEERATPDCTVFMHNGSVHIFEYKTGHAAQDLSDVNDQGQAQVACVMSRFELQKVTHHMLSMGNERDERHTKTTYLRHDFKQLHDELKAMAIASSDMQAPRTPGPNCKFCPAKGTWKCPESLMAAQSMIIRPVLALVDSTPQDRSKFVHIVLEKWPVIKDQLAIAKELLRDDPESIPGIGLKHTGSTRKFTDNMNAIDRLIVDYGVTVTEIIEASATLSISHIEEMIWSVEKHRARKQGRKPQRQSNVVAEFRKAFEDIILVFPKDQSLIVLDERKMLKGK